MWKLDLAAGHLDSGLQDGRGGGAIDIVIAVDADFFAVADCALQARQRAIHIEQRVRRMELIESRIEEPAGGGEFAKSTADEKAGDGRSDSQLSRQGIGPRGFHWQNPAAFSCWNRIRPSRIRRLRCWREAAP